jgi:hypothetical protein
VIKGDPAVVKFPFWMHYTDLMPWIVMLAIALGYFQRRFLLVALAAFIAGGLMEIVWKIIVSQYLFFDDADLGRIVKAVALCPAYALLLTNLPGIRRIRVLKIIICALSFFVIPLLYAIMRMLPYEAGIVIPELYAPFGIAFISTGLLAVRRMRKRSSKKGTQLEQESFFRPFLLWNLLILPLSILLTTVALIAAMGIMAGDWTAYFDGTLWVALPVFTGCYSIILWLVLAPYLILSAVSPSLRRTFQSVWGVNAAFSNSREDGLPAPQTAIPEKEV